MFTKLTHNSPIIHSETLDPKITRYQKYYALPNGKILFESKKSQKDKQLAIISLLDSEEQEPAYFNFTGNVAGIFSDGSILVISDLSDYIVLTKYCSKTLKKIEQHNLKAEKSQLKRIEMPSSVGIIDDHHFFRIVDTGSLKLNIYQWDEERIELIASMPVETPIQNRVSSVGDIQSLGNHLFCVEILLDGNADGNNIDADFSLLILQACPVSKTLKEAGTITPPALKSRMPSFFCFDILPNRQIITWNTQHDQVQIWDPWTQTRVDSWRWSNFDIPEGHFNRSKIIPWSDSRHLLLKGKDKLAYVFDRLDKTLQIIDLGPVEASASILCVFPNGQLIERLENKILRFDLNFSLEYRKQCIDKLMLAMLFLKPLLSELRSMIIYHAFIAQRHFISAFPPRQKPQMDAGESMQQASSFNINSPFRFWRDPACKAGTVETVCQPVFLSKR